MFAGITEMSGVNNVNYRQLNVESMKVINNKLA